MQSLHGNRFEPQCCNKTRRMVLPGGIILCIYCDRAEGTRTIIPNMTRATIIPKAMRVWEVPRA